MAAADSSTNVVVTVHCVVLFLNAKRKLVKPYFTDETRPRKVSTYFLIIASFIYFIPTYELDYRASRGAIVEIIFLRASPKKIDFLYTLHTIFVILMKSSDLFSHI